MEPFVDIPAWDRCELNRCRSNEVYFRLCPVTCGNTDVTKDARCAEDGGGICDAEHDPSLCPSYNDFYGESTCSKSGIALFCRHRCGLGPGMTAVTGPPSPTDWDS